MSLFLVVWLCGWIAGTAVAHKAARRTWNSPDRARRWNLSGVRCALSALPFWWLYLLAVPVAIRRDSRYRTDGGGRDV